MAEMAPLPDTEQSEKQVTTIIQHRLSTQSWFTVLALILVAWFMIDNVAMLLELTWILFGAFILSVMLRPLADLLAHHHIPRGMTVLFAYGLLIGGLIVIFRLITPVVGVEAASLRTAMPTLANEAMVLATLSVLPLDPWLALWVVLFMTTVTVIGSHILTPVLFGRAVGLNSLVVLIALFVGAQLQGILGMIFAIPLAVIIDTVLQEITFPSLGETPAETAPVSASAVPTEEPCN